MELSNHHHIISDMDRWCEIVPGSNVWYSTRELYNVVVVCVANRSSADVEVEIDLSRSENLSLFLPVAVGGSGASSRYVVTAKLLACTTKAVATLSPHDDTLPSNLCIRPSIVDGAEIRTIDAPSPPPRSDVPSPLRQSEALADAAMLRADDAEQQSAAVQWWLQSRRQRSEPQY